MNGHPGGGQIEMQKIPGRGSGVKCRSGLRRAFQIGGRSSGGSAQFTTKGAAALMLGVSGKETVAKVSMGSPVALHRLQWLVLQQESP